MRAFDAHLRHGSDARFSNRIVPPADLDKELPPFPSSNFLSRSARTETIVLPADKSMIASFTRLRDKTARVGYSDTIGNGSLQWKEHGGLNLETDDPESSGFIQLRTAGPRDVTLNMTDSISSDLN